MRTELSFVKGHGTLNDFVVFADPDGAFDPSPAQVAFLCDRRAGVGGDGILRVTRARQIDGWAGDPDLWFMDYRNADGSIAEMCGNGVRVFLRYLKHAGLVASDAVSFDIGTRAGVRTGEYLADGSVRVWMGRPTLSSHEVTVTCGGSSFDATAVDVGNPHAVSLVDAATLDALDLGPMPGWAPLDAFPHGVNLEFVEIVEADRVRMRVYERGVGETFSCGTGTVAAASAVAQSQGRTRASIVVEVPGGSVRVDLDGQDAYLTGPAEIVYSGTITLPKELDV